MQNNLNEFFEPIIFHGGGGEATGDKFAPENIITKVVGLVIILSLTLIFGFMPYFW